MFSKSNKQSKYKLIYFETLQNKSDLDSAVPFASTDYINYMIMVVTFLNNNYNKFKNLTLLRKVI